MGEPLHDIDQFFRDGIEGHTEYPSKDVWDKVEAGLDRDIAVTYRRKYYSLKRAAVVLAVLLLGIVTYLLIHSSGGEDKVAGAEKSNDTSISKEQKTNSSPSTGDGEKPQDDKQLRDIPDSGRPSDIDQADAADPARPVAPVNSIPGNQVNGNPTIDDKLASRPNDNHSARRPSERVQPAKPDDQSRKSPLNLVGTGQSRNRSNTVDQGLQAEQTDANRGRRSAKLQNLAIQSPRQTITGAGHSQEPDSTDAGLVGKDETTAHQRYYERLIFSPVVALAGVQHVLSSDEAISSQANTSILAALRSPAALRRQGPWAVNRGWAIQAFVMPSSANNNVEDDDPHQYNGGGPGGPPVQDHREIKNNEARSTAFSGGLKISYGFSRKLSVATGISFIRSITTEKSKTLYAERDNNGRIGYRSDCSSGYTYFVPEGSGAPNPGDKKKVSNIHTTTSYVAVPLELQYRLGFGRLSFVLASGGQFNFLRKGTTSATFDKGTQNETTTSSSTQGLRANYFSALATVNAEWRISDHWIVGLGPTGQFALSSINQGASVKTRPNYFGLSAGLRFKL